MVKFSLPCGLFELDRQAAVWFRWVLGAFVAVQGAESLGTASLFLSDYGVLPREVVLAAVHQPERISLNLMSGAVWFASLLLLARITCGFLIVAGWFTRPAIALAWFLIVSEQIRQPFTLQAGDILLRIMLFWAFFLKLDWGGRLEFRGRSFGRPSAPLHPVWETIFVLQLCTVYFFTVLHKLKDSSWRDGTAVYYALRTEEHATFLARPLLDLLPDNGWSATIGSLLVEGVAPLILLVGWRNTLIRRAIPLLMIAFHLALSIFLSIGYFSIICVAYWLAMFRSSSTQSTQPSQESISMSGSLRRSRLFLRQQIGAIVLWALVLCWNAATVLDQPLPAPIRGMASTLALDQRWNMFQSPFLDVAWFVIPARTRQGQVLDLYTGEALDWKRPVLMSSTFRSEKWRKFMMSLIDPERNQTLSSFGRYLCRAYNQRRPTDDPIVSYRVVRMREAIPAPGVLELQPPAPMPYDLWHGECFDGAFQREPPP